MPHGVVFIYLINLTLTIICGWYIYSAVNILCCSCLVLLFNFFDGPIYVSQKQVRLIMKKQLLQS